MSLSLDRQQRAIIVGVGPVIFAGTALLYAVASKVDPSLIQALVAGGLIMAAYLGALALAAAAVDPKGLGEDESITAKVALAKRGAAEVTALAAAATAAATQLPPEDQAPVLGAAGAVFVVFALLAFFIAPDGGT